MELLAVIVILAIIMIIAIPAVLNTMQSAGRSNFETYARRIANETQKKFTEDNLLGEVPSQTKIYNITKELGLNNTGDYKGYSLISPKSNTVYLILYNKEYAYIAVNMSNADLKKELKSISSVDPSHLTPEYLCSVVEECTSCTYLSVDEDGNESYGVITPEKHEYDALLNTGYNWKVAINSLVPTDQVTEVKYSDTIPDNVNKKNIALSSSKYPVYIWNDGTVIYYSTEANNIFLNSNCESMFNAFYNIVSIDTTKFRFDEVTNMNYMFLDNYKLKNLDVSNWRLPNLIKANYIFSNCKELENIDVSNWGVQSVEEMVFTFRGCVLLKYVDFSKWSWKELNKITSLFYEDASLELVKFPNSSNKITDAASAFTSCTNLKRIENIENFDTSSIIRMHLIFKNCTSLESLDVRKWVFGNLVNIGWAFQNCKELKELRFDSADFSKTTSFSGMCFGCSNLETITFAKRNFSSVESLNLTFAQCTNLKELDLSNSNFSKLDDMRQLFSSDSNITKINFSNLYAPMLTSMQGTFWFCSSLKELNLNGFVCPNLENMYLTFSTCSVLETLDLSTFNTTKVKNMDQTFYLCSNLREIDMSGIKSKIVETMINTFNGCKKLSIIYVSSDWSNESLSEEGKTSTFYTCDSLPGYISSKKSSGDYAKVNGGYFTLKG